MIYRLAVILFVVLNSVIAQADWKLDSVIFKAEKVSEPKELAIALHHGKFSREFLTIQELSNTTKLIISSLSVSLTQYHWENDSNCEVPEPEKIPPVIFESGSATYFFAINPFYRHSYAFSMGLAVPCSVPANLRTAEGLTHFKATELK